MIDAIGQGGAGIMLDMDQLVEGDIVLMVDDEGLYRKRGKGLQPKRQGTQRDIVLLVVPPRVLQPQPSPDRHLRISRSCCCSLRLEG